MSEQKNGLSQVNGRLFFDWKTVFLKKTAPFLVIPKCTSIIAIKCKKKNVKKSVPAKRPYIVKDLNVLSKYLNFLA